MSRPGPVRHQYQRKRGARISVGPKANRTVDGILFASVLEAKYYQDLKLRIAVGEVLFFLRQAPFHLPGGSRYVVDFVEFWNDGTVHFVDVKGHQTEMFKRNKRQVEDLYPVEIEVK